MTPQAYKDRPYLFHVGRVVTHQRAEMMNDLLAAADKVTLDQAVDIAFNPEVYRAERWQAWVKEAWSKAAKGNGADADAGEVASSIGSWNRRSDADSEGALAYYAFKHALGREVGSRLEPPSSLSDEATVAALRKAAGWLRSNFGAVRVPYGRYFRVGRRGADRTWPVGGGSLRDEAMATPRAISFEPTPDGKAMVGRGGQTSTQIILLTDPPQSFGVIPLGESDHEESGHWDDQAEKLFSRSRVAPTYFLRPEELARHVRAKTVLSPAPAAPTAP
jgi:acyl-homoserine lactone acylase PvdQ